MGLLLDSEPAPQSGGLLPYLVLVKLKARGSATVLCPDVQLPPISTQVRKTCILQGERSGHKGSGRPQQSWADPASPSHPPFPRHLRAPKKAERGEGQLSSQESFQEEILHLASWHCDPWQLPGTQGTVGRRLAWRLGFPSRPSRSPLCRRPAVLDSSGPAP